jgi:hypothetical protein
VEVQWFDVSASVTNKDELKDALKKGDKVRSGWLLLLLWLVVAAVVVFVAAAAAF